MSEGTLAGPGPLRPPAALSPSRYAALLDCRLQYVWGASEPPRLPLPPQARVGSLIHRLFARAERGDIPAEMAAVRAAWDEEASKIEAEMAASWLERNLLPLRRRMRDYEDRRQAALRRALEMARGAWRGSGRGGLPPEADLATPDGLVRGSLDLVATTAHGVVIRDHKTGQAIDIDPQTRLRAPKRSYALQLRLYAALYHERARAWPNRLEIVTLQGETVDVPFTPGECTGLLEEASRQVTGLATQVRGVAEGRAALASLASPGGHCSSCAYRPICPAYRGWYESTADESAVRRRDVWGQTTEVRPTRVPLVNLHLARAGQSICVVDLDGRPARNPALQGLRPGEPVGVFNLEVAPIGGADAFRAGDFTVVYRLRS